MPAIRTTHFFLFALFASTNCAFGQLTNNGATIVIESGATLVVEATINDSGNSVPTEVTMLTVGGPSIPFGVLNAGGGIIDAGTPGIVSWSFDPPLTLDLNLGELFTPGLTQLDFDTLYSASYVPFGSVDSLSVPIILVPEPSSLLLASLAGLLFCSRRR